MKKYLPFLTGHYSTAPGLLPIHRQEHAADQLIFQIDQQYSAYRANKLCCREENIHKYYIERDCRLETMRAVNEYLVYQLQYEYPLLFDFTTGRNDSLLTNLNTGEIIRWRTATMELEGSAYVSLFDALCSQVQEDLAICQLTEARDWLAAIHLCAPNHWSAADKIGKPFDAVHAPVPGMEKTMPSYFKMLQSIVDKGPFTRFAWGIGTDYRLNHHPEPPPGWDPKSWHGRKINRKSELFIRTERQNLVGFPAQQAFLFTIRTYFYPVRDLDPAEKTALWSAVRSMSHEALAYKGLEGVTAWLAEKLFEE
ncbi:heme-dependent oxidative N-demethylase family protein [Flavihumibacter petaseus]|uniref:DUF3445 domain-containing protein n=1 Tax=Flavihumibacter petaseus NBRC 106054 TaxID=1220578 RepID=A0A0E9N4E7_9BACT|nr:DUF3445 domain-containing protein [Flavihumibacter petaseus]GAO44663.1 hypothetical protein FPE01S_03_07020 [Flavihumibacter petaseus NBRC 106054]